MQENSGLVHAINIATIDSDCYFIIKQPANEVISNTSLSGLSQRCLDILSLPFRVRVHSTLRSNVGGPSTEILAASFAWMKGGPLLIDFGVIHSICVILKRFFRIRTRFNGEMTTKNCQIGICIRSARRCPDLPPCTLSKRNPPRWLRVAPQTSRGDCLHCRNVDLLYDALFDSQLWLEMTFSKFSNKTTK